jgi:hypothetical protein
VGRILFELGAQALDVHVHGRWITAVPLAPDQLQRLLAAHDAAIPPDEQLQQPELLGREVDGELVAHEHVAPEVHDERPAPQDFTKHRTRATAQDSPQPSRQLPSRDTRHDAVVGTCLQEGLKIGPSLTQGDHDGDVAAFAQGAQLCERRALVSVYQQDIDDPAGDLGVQGLSGNDQNTEAGVAKALHERGPATFWGADQDARDFSVVPGGGKEGEIEGLHPANVAGQGHPQVTPR